ncbi:unnamed protein product [Meloidogyne enterolobii]
MRLNDVEMGLVNVEEECAFLRQRCSDYDLQLIKQRDNYDMLMGKYNEVCAQLVTAEKAAASAEKPLQQPYFLGTLVLYAPIFYVPLFFFLHSNAFISNCYLD